jgi:DNA-binding Xre family transcriptional regulator
MAVSYKKLYKVLEEKKVSMVELRKSADIAPNTMTRIRKDEEVSLEVLGRICHILRSDFGDIMEYVEEKEGYKNDR